MRSVTSNLWISAHSRRGVAAPIFSTNSARDVMRVEGDSAPMTLAFFITPSICLSSSSRSVMTRMRASGSCSSSHLATSTMTMLLPLPWVCQMTPPSRLVMRSWAAFTPKNWCGLGTFLWPASKMMKLRIRSSSRALVQSCANGRSSSAPAAGAAPAEVASLASSFHSTKNCSGVPVVP